MRSASISMTFLLLLSSASPAVTQETAKTPAPIDRKVEETSSERPTFLLAFRSTTNLVVNGRYLLSTAYALGNREALQQNLILTLAAGPHGERLKGVDRNKPLGVYAAPGPAIVDGGFVLFVPVTDQRQFLEFLERFLFRFEETEPGLYRARYPQVPFNVWFRFHQGHAFITAITPWTLQTERLLDPASFGLSDMESDFLLTLRPTLIPESIRALLDSRMGIWRAAVDRLAESMDPNPMVAAQFAAGRTLLDAVTLALDSGEALEVYGSTDRESGAFVADLRLKARARSRLARNIAALGTENSRTRWVLSEDATLRFSAHGYLLDALFWTFWETWEQSLIQNRATSRILRTILFEGVRTFVNSQLRPIGTDVSLEVGPTAGGQPRWLAAVAINDGVALELLLRQGVEAETPILTDVVKLDVDRANGLSIHSLDLSDSTEGVQLRFAIRDDVVLFSSGQFGLASIRAALTKKQEKVGGPILSLDTSFLDMLRLLDGSEDSNPITEELEEKLGAGFRDRLVFSISGGDTLSASVHLHPQVSMYMAQKIRENAESAMRLVRSLALLIERFQTPANADGP